MTLLGGAESQSSIKFKGSCGDSAKNPNRRRNSYKSFGELQSHLAGLRVRNGIIDGELVCLDTEGWSVFNELLFQRGCPTFYAFDLLYLNDRDLRQLPLVQRKRRLRDLIGKSGLADVACGKYVEGRGIDLFNEVCQRNLEGVVAKRTNGTYAIVSRWLKNQEPGLHPKRSGGTNSLIRSSRVELGYRPFPKNIR